MELAKHLEQRSREICQHNSCTDEEHQCGSYAYINADFQLLNICLPDYFQGSRQPHAAIPLPWTGTQEELEQAVQDDLDE